MLCRVTASVFCISPGAVVGRTSWQSWSVPTWSHIVTLDKPYQPASEVCSGPRGWILSWLCSARRFTCSYCTWVTAVSFTLVQGDDVTEQYCGCSRSGPFALLATSAGIPSSSGAFPGGRLSVALLSSSGLGVSSSSFYDRQALHSLHRGIWDGVLPAVQVRVMLHPPFDLLALACDGFTSSRFKWPVLLCVGPMAFLIPSLTPLVKTANCILSQSCIQQSLAHLLAVHCTLLLAALRACSIDCVLVFQQYGTLFLNHSVEFSSIRLEQVPSLPMLPAENRVYIYIARY